MAAKHLNATDTILIRVGVTIAVRILGSSSQWLPPSQPLELWQAPSELSSSSMMNQITNNLKLIPSKFDDDYLLYVSKIVVLCGKKVTAMLMQSKRF
jgi:hypothetical protein